MLFVLSSSCGNLNTTSKIVSEMTKLNVYHEQYIGLAGVESSQWKLFDNLKAIATEEELIELTQHENAVVRCYAFRALVDNNYNNCFEIFTQHYFDTSTVEYQLGCLVLSKCVGKAYLDLIYNKLMPEEKTIADSVLIFNENFGFIKSYAFIPSVYPKEKYYYQIRKEALKKESFHFYYLLATYNKKQDVQLFEEYFKRSKSEQSNYKIISIYPAQEFYGFLLQGLDEKMNISSNSYQLLKAFANYKTPQTIELFNSFLNQADSSDKEAVGESIKVALSKTPDPYFFEITNKLDSMNIVPLEFLYPDYY